MQLRDLNRQYEAMKAEVDDAIAAVVASGAFIMGEPVAALERELAQYVGVRHCVSCANGTDALRLALMAIGIGPGDTVMVPDFTFFATAEAVAMVGARPLFVDVDSTTYNIDPADVERKYTDATSQGLRVRAIIAVDLFGLPADYSALQATCRKHGLHLIEDGAQGFGGSTGGHKACSLGDISCTSFFPSKPLGCYGDGGALFTDNDEYAALLRSLRVHGKGADKYDNVRLGLNSRLDTMQAAVLRVKLRHLDDELRAVRRIAERYTEQLRGVVQVPTVPDGMTSAWAQYTIRTDGRDGLQARLKADGIPTAVYYPRPMSRQTAFADLRQEPCLTAEAACQRVLSLPIHPYLDDAEADLVVAQIKKNLQP